MPQTYSVPPAPPHNEGKTTAAWVMTVGTVIGSIVVALGLVFSSSMMMAVGAAVIALTIVLSIVLRMAGLGQKSRSGARP
ncbi:HGxxPAAW family protein [Brachybacterium hainanense]|uniref:HGxxPAAW family protein n=1 Tax=Brachybacterium hainanense TaxID=1541174 RepID=A0ABV6RER1_9MICO